MASWQAIPPPQKPIQMRPRVPLSNPENTHGPNAHAQSHDWPERSVSTLIRAAGRPPGPGWGTHNIKPHAKVSHYHRPPHPHPPHHRTAAPSSSAARSPWPRPPFALCCACVSCCGSVSKGQNTRAQRNRRHTQQFFVFIFKKQPHKRNKRTQSAKSRTAALLLCLVPPSPSLLPRATPCDRPRHPSQRLATRRQSWGQTSV